jgi:hypothetical protein
MAAIAALATVVSSASAAPPKAATAVKGKLELRTVTVTKPALLAIVRTRPAYNANAMLAAVIATPTSVQLKLKNGARVALDKASAPTTVKVTVAPDPTLAPLRQHVEMEWVQAKPSPVVSMAAANDVSHIARETPIRDQGTRGTCTAFAAVAALESFYSWKNNSKLNLSENQAYHLAATAAGSSCPEEPGILLSNVTSNLSGALLCDESRMPYATSLPASDSAHVPQACSGAPLRYGFQSTQRVPLMGESTDPFRHSNNTNYLETILYSGHDLAYNVLVAGTDWFDGKAETGVIDVQSLGGQPAPAVGAHAMLLVGYHRDTTGNGGYFVFKNSWGPDVGHAGYFNLSYTYLQVYGNGAFYVTSATPLTSGASTSPGTPLTSGTPTSTLTGGTPSTNAPTRVAALPLAASACLADAACLTGRCDRTAHRCVPKDGTGKTGVFCTSNSQCSSHACSANACGAATVSVTGTAITLGGPKVYGSSCSELGAACAGGSGQCVLAAAEGRCAPLNGTGETADFCTESAQCKSNVCASNACR